MDRWEWRKTLEGLGAEIGRQRRRIGMDGEKIVEEAKVHHGL
jgi:hypothetical protein